MDATPPKYREKGEEGSRTGQPHTQTNPYDQNAIQQSRGIRRLSHASTNASLSEADSDVDSHESDMDSHGDAYRRKKAQLKANRGLRAKSTQHNPNGRADGVDSDFSSLSTNDEVELDRLESEDRASTDEDEETGLTRKAKRKRNKRRRRTTDLDARIGGSNNLAQSKGPADRKVLVNLMINACLIGLWYFFSLSISLVSLPSFRSLSNIGLFLVLVQHVDVLAKASKFQFPSLYYMYAHAGAIFARFSGLVLHPKITSWCRQRFIGVRKANHDAHVLPDPLRTLRSGNRA